MKITCTGFTLNAEWLADFRLSGSSPAAGSCSNFVYPRPDRTRSVHDFAALAERVGIRFVETIPISALAGDNVVEPGTRMAWYAGPTLLEYLETVTIRPAVEMEHAARKLARPDAAARIAELLERLAKS